MLWCWACHNFGHIKKICLSRSRPNLIWKPKPPRDKDLQLDLDFQANFPDHSASIFSGQKQAIADLHPPSSPHFQHGQAPDIYPEDVLGNNVTNDGSSSPSDASSTQMEDHARFVAS
jgi:hypothetical protein